jgi:hypothetical protein
VTISSAGTLILGAPTSSVLDSIVLSGVGVAVGTLVGLGGGAVGGAVDAAPQAEMTSASAKKNNNIIILRSLICFIPHESFGNAKEPFGLIYWRAISMQTLASSSYNNSPELTNLLHKP